MIRVPGSPERSDEDAGAAIALPAHIRACLFDLDGVLTQTAKLHAVAWKQLFDAFLRERSGGAAQPFVPFDAAADYARYVDGKLRLDGAKAFLASRGIVVEEAVVEHLASRKDALLLELLRTGPVETYPGSVRFVKAVRKASLRTAVVSASQHCREVLASAGLTELFDVRIDGVVAAEERLPGKPAPDTVLAAARRLGVDAPHAAVFEDALSGVEAGRAGRFGYVVGVDRAGQAAALRSRGADVVVTDLGALLEPR
jgi:beta-phosphoglucomutase family hydrolase